jgi:hypothetical protein
VWAFGLGATSSQNRALSIGHDLTELKMVPASFQLNQFFEILFSNSNRAAKKEKKAAQEERMKTSIRVFLLTTIALGVSAGVSFAKTDRESAMHKCNVQTLRQVPKGGPNFEPHGQKP